MEFMGIVIDQVGICQHFKAYEHDMCGVSRRVNRVFVTVPLVNRRKLREIVHNSVPLVFDPFLQ